MVGGIPFSGPLLEIYGIADTFDTWTEIKGRGPSDAIHLEIAGGMASLGYLTKDGNIQKPSWRREERVATSEAHSFRVVL